MGRLAHLVKRRELMEFSDSKSDEEDSEAKSEKIEGHLILRWRQI